MKKKLVIIDVQNDFVTEALGTKQAQQMLPRLVEKAENFEGEILMTQDNHFENYLETQEGRMLPVIHCIKGTRGWELVPELEELRKKRKVKVYQKPCFGSIRLAEDLKAAYEDGLLDGVELAGLCTDICVISNALLIKSVLPELPVFVDAGCCAGVTVQKHEAALEVMKSCQIIVDAHAW